MTQSMNICFTWNNPPVVDGNVQQPTFNGEKMHYLVYQYEKGSNGTFHWQGYVEFKAQTRYSTARGYLRAPGAACFTRRGNQQQARDYCMKDDTRVEGGTPFEHGTPKETNQGDRKDIHDLRDAVISGKRKREIIEDDALLPAYAKYYKFSDRVESLYPPERTTPRKVYLLIGPPRCGKTRSVMEQFRGPKRTDLFKVPLNGKSMWFDGYDKQRDVLIDDFAGAASKIGLTEFLRLIDPWGTEYVEIKGHFTWWNPDRIFITTNIWPREWYKWENRVIQYQAMAERFYAVFDFYEMEEGAGDPPVGDNTLMPYMHESYINHGISFEGCKAPPRYTTKTWWVKERPDDASTW